MKDHQELLNLIASAKLNNKIAKDKAHCPCDDPLINDNRYNRTFTVVNDEICLSLNGFKNPLPIMRWNYKHSNAVLSYSLAGNREIHKNYIIASMEDFVRGENAHVYTKTQHFADVSGNFMNGNTFMYDHCYAVAAYPLTTSISWDDSKTVLQFCNCYVVAITGNVLNIFPYIHEDFQQSKFISSINNMLQANLISLCNRHWINLIKATCSADPYCLFRSYSILLGPNIIYHRDTYPYKNVELMEFMKQEHDGAAILRQGRFKTPLLIPKINKIDSKIILRAILTSNDDFLYATGSEGGYYEIINLSLSYCTTVPDI